MKAMSSEEQWLLAQAWVQSNRVLIWCIAAPYFHFMSCDAEDLQSESLVTAYSVLSILINKQKELSLMSRYYRVVFRTQCIRLTTGVLLSDYDITQIPNRSGSNQEELDPEVIHDVLRVLTNRQRQITQWILSQPTPVSTSTIGKEFGIQARTVRAILHNAIRRIEDYGHQRVQQELTSTA